MSPAAPERPVLPKRFYADAAVAPDGSAFAVHLDGRGIRTPLRRPLQVPTAALAEAVAAEWRAQGEWIDPATMPLTRLLNTAVDGVADTLAATRDDLAAYVETDLLFYRAGEPERLVARQDAVWSPVVAWAERRLGARFSLAEGVMHVAQPPSSIAAFRNWASGFHDPLLVAALHQMTTLTGSALLTLAVTERHRTPAEAWSAAHLDEDWNIALWGADDEAAARRAARERDFLAACAVAGALA